MADKAPTFYFQLLKKSFPSLDDKDNQEKLLKWSMKGRLCAQMYSFDQQFQPYQKDDFVAVDLSFTNDSIVMFKYHKDFMKDPNVVSSLHTLSTAGSWSAVGTKATDVKAEIVPCTVLSMTLFDRLQENGIVRESGSIAKCFDEFYGDFTISDELRKMLLVDDSDNYCLYEDSEREEFLFRLFQHFCLGGQLCQYEDNLEPYLDITKQVYKDLVSVQKNSETKELNIISCVFKISASDDGHLYYPSEKEHEQTFSYFIVDPLKRHVTVFYHKFGASIFQ